MAQDLNSQPPVSGRPVYEPSVTSSMDTHTSTNDDSEDDDEDMAASHSMSRSPSPFSTGTSLTSVDSVDSAGYYKEESGRMFASAPNVPVVLPVDHAETRRLTDQFELLKMVCGGNYWGPVKEVLKYDPGATHRPRVLHVVSNSPWIDEMAEEFPHAEFVGCHFVPTRHLYHENVKLEVYNLNEGFRGKDGSFDLIHASCTFKMTQDFKKWIVEFKRLLRPGGLLLLVDLEMRAWMCDGTHPRYSCPALDSFSDCVEVGLQGQGIDLSQMPLRGNWLRELGGFVDIQDTVTSIPVGDWETRPDQKEIGTIARDNIMSVLYSVHPLYQRLGKTLMEVERLIQEARVELYEKNLQLFERMLYVVATRGTDD